MPIDLHSKADFISAAKHAPKPVAFLLGSPLSTDPGGGVPGIGPILDLIREEIRTRAVGELPRFEADMVGKVGADAYKAAMRWLLANFTQDAVNHVVERAVLKARRAGSSDDFPDIGEVEDWYLPSGTKQIGELITRQHERFPGPILTTNFDPLFAVTVERMRSRANWHILDSDGYFGRTAAIRRGEIQIVHLHGYWRGADTLHTPAQLTSDRPKLEASLQRLLRQCTLIVAAYGGWDDVFTKALAKLLSSGHPDDVLGVNVLWCFREDDAALVEARYKHVFEQMPSGRFLAYGGIDCHSIFAEIGGFHGSSGSSVTPLPKLPPIAGWEQVDHTYLAALSPLSDDELIKYFDGAVPTWRHAISPSVPHRQAASLITSRLATFQPGKYGCSVQLIRAAGGEGKTTLLLQAASDAARTGQWTVLWRPSPNLVLPPEHILKLDADKLWLIVADDADNLVEDLSESARLLHEAGRSNVHFLLAARDADWWAKFGDKPSWESWGTSWVRRNGAIMLRGITRDDATAIVEAWRKCGADGLRELASLPEATQQVDALVNEVRKETSEQYGRRHTFEGSFFGGLLAVRFGQSGLQAHVRSFLNRLKDEPIKGSDSTLFDALVYVAACHAVGIPGLDQNVLADLVGVPRDWVQTRVVRPLGEEAAAVQSAGNVFTRHPRVAAAILLEADQILDVAEVWSAVVRQTVRTGREIRVTSTFGMIVHAGPRLLEELPTQFPKQRRTEIALAAARTAIAHNPGWLGCIVSLAKTYRRAGNIGDAQELLRDNLESANAKIDFSSHVRGYWHEWGVSEGLLGDDPRYRAADAWLQGLSISDHLNPAPLTDEDVKQSCASLGIACGILAQPRPDCHFACGRRAATYLGRLSKQDSKSARDFDKIDREADRIHTPHPRDNEEAIAWLKTAVAQAGRELQDAFLKNLIEPELVSFQRLGQFIVDATRPVSDLADSVYSLVPRTSVQTPQPDRIAAATKTYVERRERPSIPEQQSTNEGDLRSRVFAAICDLIEKSLLKQRPLYLPLVGKVLGYQFSKEWPVHNTLGFRDLTGLILSFEEFAVTGEHPKWLVSFREDWQTTREKGLRYEVWNVIKDLVERSIFENRSLYLPTVGSELAKRLPKAKPIHGSLGFETLTGFIESFDDFTITGEHPGWVVEYRQDKQTAGAVDLRSEVASLISSLIEIHLSKQWPLLLLLVGVKLAEQFPEAKPVHKTLGFGTLTDLVLSFDEFTVTGEHPRWLVQYREDRPTADVEDLRYEVSTAIGDLIDRSNLKQLPLHLPMVGLELAERFPESKPVHRSLGFETLTDLIRSFDDFSVIGEHPRWIVQYRDVSTDSLNIAQ